MEKNLTNNTFKLIYFSANLNPFTFLSDLGKKIEKETTSALN
jgi:hypothetical protein